ncbi:high frequency lysogenization protein [Nicoletella semolina]|uniref:High frequency lysogenization protein HflD homolog n=1 Tax=Nicoletella semolina TaxID=271160 RepID=A0A4R2N8C0_9PAST|nr:high frequency lysogenization protein HflD [Nicoletella semolina]MDH2923898.1 lysogenization protein HflD [Nicoletella semolina]TCP17213.1 high frequency lysogenization protein [Nicoletella semolina]
MANYSDITLAIAGTCQAAALVQNFAKKGTTDREMLKQSLSSLLITQPDSTLGVFDHQIQHLQLGLETTLTQFGGVKGKFDAEIGRYWIGILVLSQKLEKTPAAKNTLAQRLEQLKRQLPLYDNEILHEQMIANIASIYSDIISPLGRRIQVIGNQDNLARIEIQNRIRAALLAGIRSGILWQQVGGSRWQFLFSRKKIFIQTQQFYRSL